MNPSKEGSPEFCSFAGFAVGDTTFSIFLNYPNLVDIAFRNANWNLVLPIFLS